MLYLHDTCDEIRKKISAHLAKPGVTAGAVLPRHGCAVPWGRQAGEDPERSADEVPRHQRARGWNQVPVLPPHIFSLRDAHQGGQARRASIGKRWRRSGPASRYVSRQPNWV